MDQPHVYILLPQHKDISQAARFGKLVNIFHNGESRPAIFDREFVLEALQRLAEDGFNPDTDYILAVPPIAPLVMFTMAAVREYPCLRVLFYDSKREDYIFREIGGCDDDHDDSERTTNAPEIRGAVSSSERITPRGSYGSGRIRKRSA